MLTNDGLEIHARAIIRFSTRVRRFDLMEVRMVTILCHDALDGDFSNIQTLGRAPARSLSSIIREGILALAQVSMETMMCIHGDNQGRRLAVPA